MNRRIEPLDAEERELADLLAREALPGPSPQLDARILAAARAATTPASRHPRRRWIAGLGIAASLVLAVGIAWRLRPLPERPAASEAVMAVRVAERMDRVPATAPAVADAVYSQPQLPAQEAAKPVAAERESGAARKAAPAEPPVVFDEPSPMESQAPAPPPPPAPVAAPAPVANGMAAPAASATQAAPMQKQADSNDKAKTLDRIEVKGSQIPASAPQAFSRDASGLDAAAAADAAASGEVVPSQAELDEEPPATADSPQVQEAWLQRIRELLSAGETEAARNSLAEFRHRYPKYVLPEDLRRFVAP